MRDEDYLAIGKRLFFLRRASDLTQAAIGDRVGATMNRWNNWENGVARIPVPEAIQLVQAYGVTLDWIYYGSKVGLKADLLLRIDIGEEAGPEELVTQPFAAEHPGGEEQDAPALRAEIEGLREIIRRLDDQVRDLRNERNAWRAQATGRAAERGE